MYQNDDLRNVRLADVIEQVDLYSSVKMQIETELKELVDVCDLLSMVETARDFLLVTGGKPDDSLGQRMKMLRLSHGNKNRCLKQVALKHVDCLIEFLQLNRAKRLVLNKQDAFNAKEQYRQKFDNNHGNKIVNALVKKVKPDKFVAKLFG